MSPLDIDLKPEEYINMEWLPHPDDDDDALEESKPQEGLVPPVETFAISPAADTVKTPQATSSASTHRRATSSASTPPTPKITAKISGAKYFEALKEDDEDNEDPWVQPEADLWQDKSGKQQGVRRGLDQSIETLSEKILRESSESKVDIGAMFHGNRSRVARPPADEARIAETCGRSAAKNEAENFNIGTPSPTTRWGIRSTRNSTTTSARSSSATTSSPIAPTSAPIPASFRSAKLSPTFSPRSGGGDDGDRKSVV